MNNDFVSRFYALHQQAKKAPLGPKERAEYELYKEQFATALCVAQQILVRPGQQARQTFRIAVLYKLQLAYDGATRSAVTVDVSMGGFSALLDVAPKQAKAIGVTITIPKIEPLRAQADVVGKSGFGANTRVSFRFTDWIPGDAERLETALFDAVLGRFVAPK